MGCYFHFTDKKEDASSLAQSPLGSGGDCSPSPPSQTHSHTAIAPSNLALWPGRSRSEEAPSEEADVPVLPSLDGQ